MTTTRFEKFLAIAGILAGVVFVIGGFHPDPPGVSAGAQERVQWYLHHKAIMAVSGFGAGYFAVLIAFFTVGVRKLLRSGEAGESTYSSAALVGGIMIAGASVFDAVLSLASLEAADKGQPAVLTTLAFVGDFGWLPIIAGLAVFYLATGLGGLRTATLPKWLSIVTIVLGVAAVAGPTGVGAWFATPVWLIVVGVLMLRRSGAPSSVTLPSRSREGVLTS
jgi:hypothetical protein